MTNALSQTIESIQRFSQPSATTERLVNRLTGSKDLPKFKGDGVEWIRFKRAFELSTEVGGYNQAENASCLYGCLEGEAKEAVASLMTTSDPENSLKTIPELETRSAIYVHDK